MGGVGVVDRGVVRQSAYEGEDDVHAAGVDQDRVGDLLVRSADREVGLMEQVISPIRHSREEGAEGRAAQTVDEMAVLSVRLHAALVKSGLRSLR